MTAIWRQQDDEWRPLLPSGFPSEEKLHDLVEGAPTLLPLSGDPTVTVLGREVSLRSGYADLLAVESDGRLVILEIKLRRNAEARRAVVAQILTYAAYLKGLSPQDLDDLIRPHLIARDATTIADAAARSDQAGEFEEHLFSAGLAESLLAGEFRLVLVLDEAPSELVQLVGYLESIASGIVIDLITVSAYQVGEEQILVPQRVDPEYQPEVAVVATPAASRRAAKARREVDGSDAFEQASERAPEPRRAELRRLLKWARELESEQLATLRTVLGQGREILLVWVRGEKGGLVSIWNDGGAYISLWRSVFVRLAWDHIAGIEKEASTTIGQGNTIANPSQELLDAVTAAYRDAATGPPTWNGNDFYLTFGEGPSRDWDEAQEFGFVSAGGGEWYSKNLHQLEPGNRVFVYIPKGSGVGGYVGVGEVTGEAVLAKDFTVQIEGQETPYLNVTKSSKAKEHNDDPALAEWVVPVRWLASRTREDAAKDPDYFANQNTVVRLTHGYTLERLAKEFGVEPAAISP